MSRIGFVVNPYAGMGGAVGLKGTDRCIEEARARGALPVSPSRALEFLTVLNHSEHVFFTVQGIMGEDELRDAGSFHYQVIYSPISIETGPEDTRAACRAMRAEGVDLIVFCGGDGTARDVFSGVGRDVPILGIPAGVKIYSGIFALTSQAAAHIITGWIPGSCADGEVMDVDEDQYRAGILTTRIFGISRTPFNPALCQSCKQVSFGDESRVQGEIARFITDIMRDDTLYLLGAGSTIEAIAHHLNQPSTLLGIDAYYQRCQIGLDLNEQEILDLITGYDQVKIVLSPIGAQGFILGRGNQQISRRVIQKTGIDAIIVVATPGKLQHTPLLYVDTGDSELNSRFGNSILVICGYKMAQRVRIGNT